MEMNQNKRRRRFMGFGFAVLLVSITLGCSSVVLGGESSGTPSSSNASSSSASSSASSTASSSTSSSSSSASSSASSSPASSSSSSSSASSSSSSSSSASSSSNSSSTPVNGPRLTLLAPADKLNVLGSVKNGAKEFFIWTNDDANDINVSVFELNTLLNTEVIGDLFGNDFFNGEAIVAYHEGILFTIQNMGDMTGTTYYYDATGIQSSFADTFILGSSELVWEEEGIYVSSLVEGANELYKFVEPSLVPTFLTVLPLANFYSSYNDGFMNPNDLGPNFRVIGSFNTSTFTPVFEFFSVVGNTYTKLFELSQMDLMMGKKYMATDNAIFLATNPINLSMYDTTGTRYDYNNYSSIFYPQHQGVVLDQLGGDDVLIFHEGNSVTNLYSGNVIQLTNSIEAGSSFLIQNLDTSSITTHRFSATGYESTQGWNGYASANAPSSFYDNVTPQFSLYTEATNVTTIGYYDQDFVILEVGGDVTGETFNHFTMINDVPHAIIYDNETITDPNAFEILVYNGAQNNNAITAVTIEDLNITNFMTMGVVNEYLVANIAVGSNTNYQGYVINLETGTYEAIGQDIWYIGNQLGNLRKTVFYEDNGFLHGYSWGGYVSISIEDPTVFVTTSAGRLDDSEVVFMGFHEDQLGENQDVVVVETEPYPETGWTELKIYVGDMTLGLANMSLLSTSELESDSFNSLNIIISGTNVYLYDYSNFTIVTLEGDAFNGNVYVQNDAIIVIDEELYEVATGLNASDGFSVF